jgi:biopolymer transport protein ExbB
MSIIQRARKGAQKIALPGAVALAALTASTPAFAWWEADYSYRTRINLNVDAAGITGEVARAPVLIRLHSGNFSFKDVKPDGSDLRFVAGDDRTPLKFHIEKWSPQEEQALVWVDVQGLQPRQTSAIYVYYGNQAAAAQQDAAGTFGPDYKLVYHFNDEGSPRDATANGNNASGGETRNAGGLIGQSLVFDGTSPLTLPASAFAAGPITISGWVKPDSDGAIFTWPGSVSLTLDGGRLFIEQGGARSNGAALNGGANAHVALVNDGSKSILYINGQPAGEVAGALAAGTGAPLLGAAGFRGEIDEFRVAGAALPQAAFQLAAGSEGQGARLAIADTAEQVETGGGHSYLGILFRAITFDAWVVIGILAIMLVLAMATLVRKVRLVGRIENANEDFLAAYDTHTQRLGDHDGLPAFDPGAGAGESTLGELYAIGRNELAKRAKDGRAADGRFALRPQSIAAIRSALDAQQVVHGQKLRQGLGLLTNPIGGAVYVGLAGTVLGVMVTFAQVAAAGEVNIAAIAPGVAAALLATLAGLVVAIPSLFGNNHVKARMQNIRERGQVFADELEKRIAEAWQGADAPGRRPSQPAVPAE